MVARPWRSARPARWPGRGRNLDRGRSDVRVANVRRKLSILGATGSVGTSTLDLVQGAPDRFEIIALTAATNANGLAEAARRTGARFAVVADETKLTELQECLAGTDCRAAAGREALLEA